MHDLLRSVLDRFVEFEGKRYVVRSPTVREALAIIASAPGALEGEAIQRDVLFHTLRGWLPSKLYSTVSARDFPLGRVVAFVFQVVKQGVPEFDRHQEANNRDPAEVPWEDVLAEYMSTYGVTLAQALEEPWNGFLMLSVKTDQVQARQQLRALHVNSLPYIKSDSDRKHELRSLQRRARGGAFVSDEARREEMLKRQPENLERLKKKFEQLQKHPAAQ